MTPAPRWSRRPPDCRQVIRVLQSYLDGELPDDERDVVAEHLRHCQRCGIDARIYRDIKRSLQGLDTPVDRQAIRRLRGFVDHLPALESDHGH